MKHFNNILAIITAIAYNLFLKEGFKFYFFDYSIMSDLWYCLVYFHLSVYAVVSIISLVLKTKKDRDIRDYHGERKKTQVALRKYIEERTKKINNQNE